MENAVTTIKLDPVSYQGIKLLIKCSAGQLTESETLAALSAVGAGAYGSIAAAAKVISRAL